MLKEQLPKTSGQSLIEILIGIAVGVIIIGGVTATIAVTLRSNVQNKNVQSATSLSQELVNKLTDFASANWHNIDTLGSGQYHLIQSGAAFSVQSESEPAQTIDGVPFTRYFTVQSVSRDANDDIVTVGGTNDPSTKKVVITVSWQQGPDPVQTTVNKFITRSKNLVFQQTDWAGGLTNPSDPVLTVPDTTYYDKGTKLNTGTAGSVKVEGF
jgi:type II secretory pathway pseudopilin PulG